MKRAILAAVLCLALPLRAQDSAEDAKKAAILEEARQHVAKAKVHFDLGEYKEAADEYIIVYRLRPIPALLFNIAQAYRQGGLYDKARQFYKSYLREAPDLKNKAMIEQNIREMDALLAKEKRAKEAAPNGVKEPPETSLPLPDKTAAKPPAAQQKPAEVAPQKPAEVAPQKPDPVAQKSAEAPNPASPPDRPTARPAKESPSTTPGRAVAVLPPHGDWQAGGGPRPTTDLKPSPAPKRTSRTWTWIAAGASVVALGGGAAFGYKTVNGASQSDAMTANVLYGAGAVLAVASAAFFVFEF